jgi:hypothetical protein
LKMVGRENRGGDLDLLRVLRHDLPDGPQPALIYQAGRFAVILLAALAAVVGAPRMSWFLK